ncbi:hypothetical protein ACFWEB_25830 [Streptomyces parvus]|uniref:hypothetical protein n=1 Tax=Streptomyces parvus TaxID=66428 RepID=UPI00365C7D61
MAIARILADPDSGKRVIREANALLDGNDRVAMRAWLESGYRLAQAEEALFSYSYGQRTCSSL